MCQKFVDAIKIHMPHLLQRKKKNLLHLVHCMHEFGPSSAFNAERYVCVSKALCIYNYHKHMCRFESFNSKVRAYNVYGNRIRQAMT